MASDIWLVVGLGNPGPTYACHRHNLGFMVVEALAARTGANLAVRGRALAAAARIGTLPGGVPGPRAVLAQPQSFMNLSGGPTSELMTYFGVELDHLVVVHDDLDLPLGEIRLKRGGGEGGHNGLRDISKALGTRDYLRVRLGIGRPPGRQDAASYVLRDFPAAARPEVARLVEQAADAVEQVILHGLEAAQLVFHTRKVPAANPPVKTASAKPDPAGTARTTLPAVTPPKEPLAVTSLTDPVVKTPRVVTPPTKILPVEVPPVETPPGEGPAV
ncbi:MAG: aminoacyl-tRNA hydrolase [Bifidobacteriaceae bacterium]|jgi:PTH1 family peptidyl-tRNA hydrolase|nr:aminoacyl-tRNA hydrolase [Bifidobacteriaceae bacterium]